MEADQLPSDVPETRASQPVEPNGESLPRSEVPTSQESPQPSETTPRPTESLFSRFAGRASRAFQPRNIELAGALIGLIALVLSVHQLRIAASQLSVAVQDSNDTQTVLVRLLGINSDELEVLRTMLGLQSGESLQGPAATEGARQLAVLQATMESLAQERDDLLRTLVPTPRPSPAAECLPSPVSITEVMVVPMAPSGQSALDRYNEYVELYNYGTVDIDVAGWFIADRRGHPGSLIPWNDGHSDVSVGSACTTTTVIPPSGHALILSMAYHDGDRPYDIIVRSDSIILTLAGPQFIGDGLVASEGSPLDVLVLYTGTPSRIDCVVSTYGTPALPVPGGNPMSIRDDQLDNIPFAFPQGGGWGGFYRIDPEGPDRSSNWARFYWEEQSPGF